MENRREEVKSKKLVRLLNVNLDADKRLLFGLREIKGVSYTIAAFVCVKAGVDKMKKIGDLSQEELDRIKNVLESLSDIAPSWMLNRRKDYDTGKDIHLLGPKIDLVVDGDIRRLKKIRSYRGLRHYLGLPVRGQRTRAHFRKIGKNRTVGVQRKKK